MKTSALFCIVLLFFGTNELSAQKNFKEYNVIGISGGLTMFDIKTSDFSTTKREGFMFGFQMRGNVYNNFDMIYGISFYDTQIGIAAQSNATAGQKRELNYSLQSAQISVLWGYKIIRQHLSIEAGPVLNVSGKLTLKDTQYDDYIIDGYSALSAVDVEDVSRINFHLAGGLTAGFKNFRVFGQYQYGVTNMLNKLNKQDFEKSNFKGQNSLFAIGITAYF